MVPTFTSTSSADHGPGSPLTGRRVLLGVSGGIAAYKACEVARLLIGEGATVDVMLTPSATRFVTPLTFAALTGRPAESALFGPDHAAALTHTDVGMAADLAVVAPATANLLGRVALGLADDLLTSTLLVTTCPLLLCPAMNANMWANRAVQANLATLSVDPRIRVLEPDEGELACGVVGPGRLPDPAAIVAAARSLLGPRDLAGRHVVVAGGPTREHLDPVRFLSNPSSGSMATALAAALAARGADVTLVYGPGAASPPPGVTVVPVVSAAEMAAAVDDAYATADAIVMAAAVADWRPTDVATEKVAKSGATRTITFERTVDILAGLGARPDGPLLVGFAAETASSDDELKARGHAKRERKGCDLLFANRVGHDAGFGPGHTAGWLLGPGDTERACGPAPKSAIAGEIAAAIAAQLDGRATSAPTAHPGQA